MEIVFNNHFHLKTLRNPEYEIFVCICWYNNGRFIKLKYLTWYRLWKDWYLINWLRCGCSNNRKVSGHICVKWWCQRASANMANPLCHNCWAKVTIYARLMINHSCKFIEIFSTKETEELSSVTGPFLTITQLFIFYYVNPAQSVNTSFTDVSTDCKLHKCVICYMWLD